MEVDVVEPHPAERLDRGLELVPLELVGVERVPAAGLKGADVERRDQAVAGGEREPADLAGKDLGGAAVLLGEREARERDAPLVRAEVEFAEGREAGAVEVQVGEIGARRALGGARKEDLAAGGDVPRRGLELDGPALGLGREEIGWCRGGCGRGGGRGLGRRGGRGRGRGDLGARDRRDRERGGEGEGAGHVELRGTRRPHRVAGAPRMMPMSGAETNAGGGGSSAGSGSMELAPGVVVPASAVAFSFVASGGPGGQNVNKRATKAELRVRVADLPIPGDARARLEELAGRRVSESGEIVIAADEHRSQGRNRAACLERLRELIVRAMVRPKRRRATRPSRGSVERRLEGKRARSVVKRGRGADGRGGEE